jgi:hypothetical protein
VDGRKAYAIAGTVIAAVAVILFFGIPLAMLLLLRR